MKIRCKKHWNLYTRGRVSGRAAEEYGVPQATLGDRASGRVKPGAVSGPPNT